MNFPFLKFPVKIKPPCRIIGKAVIHEIVCLLNLAAAVKCFQLVGHGR